MEQLEIDISPIIYEVDLKVVETIGINQVVRQMRCGTTILDRQIVVSRNDLLYPALPTDGDLENIVGIALQSGNENDVITIMVKGLLTPHRNYNLGLLYLGSDSFLSNSPPSNGAIVCIGFKLSDTKVLIFDNKEVIYR